MPWVSLFWQSGASKKQKCNVIDTIKKPEIRFASGFLINPISLLSIKAGLLIIIKINVAFQQSFQSVFGENTR